MVLCCHTCTIHPGWILWGQELLGDFSLPCDKARLEKYLEMHIAPQVSGLHRGPVLCCKLPAFQLMQIYQVKKSDVFFRNAAILLFAPPFYISPWQSINRDKTRPSQASFFSLTDISFSRPPGSLESLFWELAQFICSERNFLESMFLWLHIKSLGCTHSSIPLLCQVSRNNETSYSN